MNAEGILSIVSACMESLPSGENPPYEDGWRVRLEMTGSPRAVEALKTGDFETAMTSRSENRTRFEREGQPGDLTIYYSKAKYIACEARIEASSAEFESVKAKLVSSMSMESLGKPSKTVNHLKHQYLLDDMTDVFQTGRFTVAFHKSTLDDKPFISAFIL